jgi:uncharacterized phage protein (TIGR01671 family)
MRELKFRAWSEETKSFEYFDLYEGTECGLTNLQIWARNNPIEQYTGLKDKKGIEIYEGDVVKWSYGLDRNRERLYGNIAIEWDTGEEDYYPYCITSGFILPQSDDGYEVIGNIHENKELLEEE